MQHVKDCMLTKQIFIWYFDAGLGHMAAHPRGNGSVLNWLIVM